MVTSNLSLPYIAASQAQKHVTHNEAIRILDGLVQLSVVEHGQSIPPTAPSDGDRFGLTDTPEGDWDGYPNHIAAFVDGSWTFYQPREGWRMWCQAQQTLLVYSHAQWVPVVPGFPDQIDDLNRLGINSTSDAQNRLSLSSHASLFSHDGADHRLKINRNGAGDTASILFQSAFSGMAEAGLIGADAFAVKTSADGTSWQTQLELDPARPGTKSPAFFSGRISVALDGVGYIPTPSSGGLIALMMTSSVGFPKPLHSGIFAYDTGASPELQTLIARSGVVNRQSATLTGSTGNVGETSISAGSGALAIENRYEIAREYSYAFLC